MIPNTLTAVQATGNGVSTVYAFNNKIFEASDLAITQIDPSGNLYVFTYQSNNQFYNAFLACTATVTNIDVDTGCSVQFSVPPTLAWTVDLRTDTPETQLTSIKNQSQFYPDIHEEAFDRITRAVQDLTRLAYTYGIHGPDIESIPWPALPGPSGRQNTAIGFNAAGALALVTPFAGSLSLSQIAGYGIDSGVVNAYVVTANTPPAFILTAGALVRFEALNTNTGPATANIGGTGVEPIINYQGNALTGGELQNTVPTWVQWTGAAWQVVGTGITPEKARTAAEIAAGVIPTNYFYLPGNVIRYGADPTGVGNSTVAIQNASNCAQDVYYPVGTYSISDQIVLTIPRQRHHGEGVNSIVFALATFNLTRAGIYVWTPSAYPSGAFTDGPQFENLHITCDQSGVATPPGAAIASASQTVANPGVFNTAAQTWAAGQPVYITGTAPGGYAANIVYYVLAAGLTATTAQLSTTIGGTALACTSSSACSLQPCFARANLIQYPAALFMRNAPRTKITNCLIEQFLIGIDDQGFSAGLTIDVTVLACYTLGVVIDGNGDTIHMDYLHCIPYETWTTNQKAIYFDGGKTDIASGRNDGMDITNSLFLGPCVGLLSFTGTGVHYPGTFAGSGWLTGKTGNALIVNTGFDTQAILQQTAISSTIALTSCYFSNGAVGNVSVVQITAGTVQITGGFSQSTPIPTVPMFLLNNAGSQIAQLNFDGGFTFNGPPGTGTLVSVTGPTLSLVSICNCNFFVTNAADGPLVTCTGAGVQLAFTGNQIAGTTFTGNVALSIDTDNTHIVQGNTLNGWNMLFGNFAPIASASQTVANPGVFTTAAQTWVAGQQVYITGTAPGGFTLNTIYYVLAAGLTGTTVELAATPGGAGIQCTASAACNLVPVSPTAFTKASISGNSNRGTLNFNNAAANALQGVNGAATIPAASTVYLGPGGYQAAAANANAFQLPKGGNIIGFQAKCSSGPGGATTYTATVYKNGVATSMTASTTGGAANFSASAGAFAVAANDNVELQFVSSAGAAAVNVKFSIIYEPA